jgi:hypothetical protein
LLFLLILVAGILLQAVWYNVVEQVSVMSSAGLPDESVSRGGHLHKLACTAESTIFTDFDTEGE